VINLVPGSITNAAALADLNEILLYIAGYNRARAVRFAGAFRVTVENLVEMPFMGSRAKFRENACADFALGPSEISRFTSSTIALSHQATA